MICLQIINKVIQSSSMALLQNYGLTVDYFKGFEVEYEFVTNHFNTYGNVPDSATFVSNFPDWELIEVSETDTYLVETIREEHLYSEAVPVIQDAAELLKTNANDAVNFMIEKLKYLEPKYAITFSNIIAQAEERHQEYKKRQENYGSSFITSGFAELDEILHGWQRGEEFVVWFARTGQGKSWVLAKTCQHAWQIGNRVGYISPEMSANMIGYRFDTLFKNFSNKNLLWGLSEPHYENYISALSKKEIPFLVSTPKDFSRKITVSKLKAFITENKLDMLGIDGISYLTDERAKRGDNKSTILTNISEDLMQLSIDLKVPIHTVVQSNRGGVKLEDGEGTPELENIRDSDGIAYNASKSIALRQSAAGLEFGIKKQRYGATGGKVVYYWNIDKGEFSYIPGEKDSTKPETRQQKVEDIKKSYGTGADVF